MKKALLVFLTIAGIQASAQTPMMIADINAGSGDSEPWMTTVFNNKLYFSAVDAVNGREVWVYDGVNSPTLLYNINPGSAHAMLGGSNTKMAELNGKLYFGADNGTDGNELMVYDGVNPPSVAYNISAGSASSNPYDIRTIGSKMYFSGTTIADDELYVFDGTNAPVKFDIRPGVAGSNPTGFTPLNGKVYFRANNGAAGLELYMYDPGTNSVGLAADIEPGVGSSYAFGLVPLNNKIYFAASTTTYGIELYSYDGTTALRLTDINPNAGNGLDGKQVAYNNMIYFSGTASGSNYQLYRYDPSNNTSSLVYNIYPGGNSVIGRFMVYNNKLYFNATDGVNGNELWVHDGTSTTLLANINPGSGSSFIRDFAVFNNKLYFTASDGVSGMELYSLTDTALSVQNAKLNGSVTVAPNPTSGDATLSLSLKQGTVLNMQVMDIAGKLCGERKQMNCPAGDSDIRISLSGEAAGTYFYRLTDDKGALMFSGKVVKE